MFRPDNQRFFRMPLRKYLDRLDRLHSLIRRKATGPPRELAERLDLSERQLYEYLQEMRDMGAPVRFCKSRQCYYYEKDVKLQLGFVEMSAEEMQRNDGGTWFGAAWL